jgi:8-oxo-dGTP pyrophosphatase MutT (NUDIX family)
MHRAVINQLLDDYRNRYPNEHATVERYQRFVADNPSCFERSLAIGHATGSAWLVNRAMTHVLLTHHRKLDIWVQLGGHADGNSDLLDVALREAREESGIDTLDVISDCLFDIDIHEIPERGSEAAHLHYDARFALRATTDKFAVSDESHALEWVEVEKLADKTTEPSMLRMADKWLTRRNDS